MSEELDKMPAEFARLRADAARYRWLRDHGYGENARKNIEREILPAGERFKSLDDAIDAALMENI
jgi:hypothetical protein